MGTLALFGSGETSSQGRKIHDYLMVRLGRIPVRVGIVETPAGFQPNVHLVYQKIGEFMEKSLQNFRPEPSYVQAYRKASPHDPDSPDVVDGLMASDYIFTGPGSPTYAARHLRDTLTLRAMVEAFRRGATLVVCSAAAIATGSYTMPVYEIFKAGADLSWEDGLHLLPMLGLDIDPVIVTHWNNTEGGAGLDTTHCYVGEERFNRLVEMLPPSTPILGIDEHTACVLEEGSDTFRVMGAGGATVIPGGAPPMFVPAGQSFPLSLLRNRVHAR